MAIYRVERGLDDELGTANFITDAKPLQAFDLVKTGRVLSLGGDLRPGLADPGAVIHRMLYQGHGPISALDSVEVRPHGYQVTHPDAPGHVYHDGWVWNGRRAEDAVMADGMTFASVQAYRHGIITRGVLLDVARARETQWLPAGEGVRPADIEAAERLAGVRVERGDAVMIRVGLRAREAVEGPEDPTVRAGLTADCLPWLHEREVALYAGDAPSSFRHHIDRSLSPCIRSGLWRWGWPSLTIR